MVDSYTVDHGLRCHNHSCKSYGQVHYNCKCYIGSGGGEGETEGGYAKGGEVHFCLSKKPHKPGCEYFMDGGPVLYDRGGDVAPPQFQDNPAETLGHAAVQHGLLGLLKNVGQSKLSDPDKHNKVLEPGHKFHKHMSDGNHEKAANTLSEHPIAGGIGKMKLKPIMERLHGPMMNTPPNSEALKGSIDYLASAMKGRDRLDQHLSGLLGNSKLEKQKPDDKAREAIKEHLADFRCRSLIARTLTQFAR